MSSSTSCSLKHRPYEKGSHRLSFSMMTLVVVVVEETCRAELGRNGVVVMGMKGRTDGHCEVLDGMGEWAGGGRMAWCGGMCWWG